MITTSGGTLGDRYRLIRPIGHGGMADVYLADDERLGRPVAVKVLREQADGAAAEERFAAEAVTLAKLSHPALVTLLDTGVTDDRPYIVFEYVDGQDLGQLLKAGAMPSRAVRLALRDVADALSYAHSLGIVHRDVKPANILIRTDGRAQLADFGIARLLDQTVHHTSASQLVGSPAYLSPEQYSGDPVTASTDVFSLGLVVLEALTGQRPTPGTPAEVAAARFSTPVRFPDDLTVPWRVLIEEMTGRDPESRPSAEDVTRRLDALPDEAFGSADPTAILHLDHPTVVLAHREPLGGQLRRQADRMHDAVVPLLAGVGKRARTVSPPRTRTAIALTAGVLVAFLLLIAVLAGGSDQTEPPSGPAVPAEYQQPFTDLRDAIYGSSR